MRILLTANASYAPPKGGSTRSNLLWLHALADAGHQCLVVCPTWEAAPDKTSSEAGVDIHSYRDLARRTLELRRQIDKFRPDWVLVSSEDLTHVLLREAARSAPGRLVYLAHTPQFYPFGPASWFPDTEATAIVRQARAVVAIAHYTADYIQGHCGRSAVVIHPPMYGTPPFPLYGSFASGPVLMINPCKVKGIDIFLALAERFPQIPFAGLVGWGTTSADREAMQRVPNVQILEPVGSIDEVLRTARLLLMPSIWFEGFGLIAMEAMLRGVPVVASDAGGLVEAKRGTGFVIPVVPVQRFEPNFDEAHMPKPIDQPQDLEPWVDALRTLSTDPAAYRAEAAASRQAGLNFVSQLRAADFADLLTSLPKPTELSDAKRALLAQRLRRRGTK